MSKLQNVKVVIPALNPDEKLLELLERLRALGFEAPLVVNDGSRKECRQYFEKARMVYGCTVLEHKENRGKGRGLKTAFSYILQKEKECRYVVTIDADGQHEPEDVLRCVEAAREQKDRILFGCRDFSQEQVPAKSRFGNRSMCLLMRFVCGMALSDTQTGLRVFPAVYLKQMLEVKGERFEYETNMLFEIRRERIPYGEVSIRTVYLEQNRSSHFRPVKDSLRIVMPFLKFISASVSSSLIDFGAFTLLFYLLEGRLSDKPAIWLATVAARVLSAVCNYTMNRRKVFGQGTGKAPVRYAVLCAGQMCLSALLVSLIYGLLKAGAPGIKVVVDVGLFFASYQIQREWVFRK